MPPGRYNLNLQCINTNITSPQFTVSKVKYPLDTGTVAPGMSVILTINFMATSLSDFEDELIIISEECSFKVRIH